MAVNTDILIVVPLEIEYKALCSIISGFERDTGVHSRYRDLPPIYVLKHKSGLMVRMTVLNVMSNQTSAMITERCILYLNPRLVIGIGIAGSLDDEVKLADIVISKSVCSYISEAKTVDSEDDEKGHKRYIIKTNGGEHVFNPRLDFISYFEGFNQSQVFSEKIHTENATDRGNYNLVTRTQNDGKEAEIAYATPKVHVGGIASGPFVVASNEFRLEVKEGGLRKYVAVEMEGAGIARACQKRFGVQGAIDFLLFRGISDFSDSRKNILENNSKGKWIELAVRNTARILEHSFNCDKFRDLIRPRHDTPSKTPLHIALVLGGDAHYVNNIAAGFREELTRIYANSPYYPHIVQERVRPESKPEDIDRIKNDIDILLNTKFGNHSPRYIVTVGTSASLAALKFIKQQMPLIYLGVSEPESLGLNSRQKTSGVSYGVEISETVELIQKSFPNRIPTFIWKNNGFIQDEQLLKKIRKAYSNQEVPDIIVNDNHIIEGDHDNNIYFGRLFLCNNISNFVKKNNKAAFVGVSLDNVLSGAVMSIGYDTIEIGRMGARDILAAHHLEGKNLNDLGTISPSEIVIGYHQPNAEFAGIYIADEIRKKVTHLFD